MLAAIVQRIIKSFVVHLVLLLIALVLVYGAVRGQDSLGTAMRMQYDGQSSDVLLQLVADARGRIMTWCLISFGVSWVASSMFLATAQRTQPSNDLHAASRRGLWSVLLLFVVAAMAILAWLRLYGVGVSTDLASGTFLIALIGGAILVLTGFYLGCALAVKASMRPSVPGATALPAFWN